MGEWPLSSQPFTWASRSFPPLPLPWALTLRQTLLGSVPPAAQPPKSSQALRHALPINGDILTQRRFEIAGLGSAPRISFANGVSVLALGLSGLFTAGDLEDVGPEGEEGLGALFACRSPAKAGRR